MEERIYNAMIRNVEIYISSPLLFIEIIFILDDGSIFTVCRLLDEYVRQLKSIMHNCDCKKLSELQGKSCRVDIQWVCNSESVFGGSDTIIRVGHIVRDEWEKI